MRALALSTGMVELVCAHKLTRQSVICVFENADSATDCNWLLQCRLLF